MFRTKNIFKAPHLIKKIFYTLIFLLIYRFGNFIPIPLVNAEVLKSFLNLDNSNTIFGLMDMFSGGAFGNATLFAMGLSPYINASIILQLLLVVFPTLERLQSNGEDGRKKMEKLQKYLSVVIALAQSVGLYYLLCSYGIIVKSGTTSFILIISSFTAGTAFLMWLGEKIDDIGIGNGISILIFAGIVSRLPKSFSKVVNYLKESKNISKDAFILLIILLVSLLIVMFVVAINYAERKIHVQYTKKIVGRMMYEGQNTHIPVKVASSGVTPIIFAMSVTMFPATIVQLFGLNIKDNIWGKILNIFSPDFWLYGVIYFFLIVFFTYFYTSIQFNPLEISNSIKKSGGFILGVRPGKPTTDYLMKVLSNVTLVGALFLGTIAVLPIVLNNIFKMKSLNIGGTSLLIVVGVTLDTARQIESQLLMKNYKGFLA